MAAADQQEEAAVHLLGWSRVEMPIKDTEHVMSGNMTVAPDAAQNNRRKVLMLGLRRSGKSSMLKVVFHHMVPNETLFLDSTTKTTKDDIDSFLALQLWDVPGQQSLDQLSLPFAQVGAIIFVVDAQDDYFDALAKLHEVILKAFGVNPGIHFHVFINKVDGLSDDYKYDTQRDIEQRVLDDLSDASAGYSSSAGAGAGGTSLETDVQLSFHLTSIFDPSVFVAFSRVQQKLLGEDLMGALEGVCNSICAQCKLDKAFLFDVSSRTYVASDASPFDASSFEACSEYVNFLLLFSGLYSNLRPPVEARNELAGLSNDETFSSTSTEDSDEGRYASSVTRLNPDTTLAFWQVNSHLALVAILRTELHTRQSGLIDYNVAFFRRAVNQLFELGKTSEVERA